MTMVVAIPAMPVTMLSFRGGGNDANHDDESEKRKQRTLH